MLVRGEEQEALCVVLGRGSWAFEASRTVGSRCRSGCRHAGITVGQLDLGQVLILGDSPQASVPVAYVVYCDRAVEGIVLWTPGPGCGHWARSLCLVPKPVEVRGFLVSCRVNQGLVELHCGHQSKGVESILQSSSAL